MKLTRRHSQYCDNFHNTFMWQLIFENYFSICPNVVRRTTKNQNKIEKSEAQGQK